MSTGIVVEVAFLAAAALFIFSLLWMNDPKTARRGVVAGVSAMVIAVAGTLLSPELSVRNLPWLAVAVAASFLVGVPLSRVPLTAVPQRTALSHSFGGIAAGLVGTAEFLLWMRGSPALLTPFRMTALVAEVILGFLTFTGSLLAAAKLQEIRWMPQRPVTYRGQNVVNLSMLATAVGLGVALVVNPTSSMSGIMFFAVVILSLAFGVMLILPIGGADMPTVISLLNAYAGLSAVAMGFVLDSKLLITAGALDGSSGLILSIVMCRAMNRSFANVLFGAFGKVTHHASASQGVYKTETPEGAAMVLEQSSSVVIIPGYGMAVAQAQHKVRELYDQLRKRGITARFAIHPVAGRMPGHMNVLLAEANIPYTDLVEMDDINPDMPQTDVAIVIGANDVVNPAARNQPSSPIFGMPIVDAKSARTVFAVKRSAAPGFAGIDNELYFADHTWMLFGDAKTVVGSLVKQLGGDGDRQEG